MWRVLLISAVLLLPLAGAAHEPLWVPPTPAAVNPCELARVRCPLALRRIYEALRRAQLDADEPGVEYWRRRLGTWYAYNRDYRRHLHPHH